MADRRAAMFFAALLALAACASLSLVVAPVPAREGGGGAVAVSGGTPRDFPEHHAAVGPGMAAEPARAELALAQAPAVATATSADAPGAPTPQAPAPPAPQETPKVPGDSGSGGGQHGDTEAAAIDPGLASPTNLVAGYEYSGTGSPKVNLSWSGVRAGNFDAYEILKWRDSGFSSMITIFYQLAALVPAALPYAQDFELQVSLSTRPYMDYSEREAIIRAMEQDIDALFAILAANPAADHLWSQLLALTVWRYETKSTKAKDFLNATGDLDRYFVYVVIAKYKGTANTSPPSNCDMVFSYKDDKVPPPAPTGFVATAYDPGVELKWDPVPQTDISGYDVYVVQGGTTVKLNAQPISGTTEYFHMTGIAGATYQVVSITYLGYRSSPASAVSVLAPATVFTCDDPAWTYSGAWYRENYTALEPGGRVIKVSDLAGSRAQITFTGRRVKLYAAKYWSCGDARIYVDGVDQGTFSFYSYDVAWQQQVFVITGLAKGVPHTITIECLGSGGPEGLNFVNVDYVEVR